MGTLTHHVFRLFVIQFLFFCCDSFGNLSFDSQSSTIRVTPGSTLSISNPISNFTGTLKRDPGAIITGEDITFVEGVFQDEGGEIKMSAVLEPTSAIVLGGNDTVRAAPSRVLQGIEISGTNNRIEGAPVFTQSVQLVDQSSSVTLAIQSDMSQDFILNGGTLFLENDLHFADEKFVVGSGTIMGDGHRLITGSTSFAFDGELEILPTADIEITADLVDFSGTVTFYGDLSINGNGGVLELQNGGKLVVAPGATLHLTDLVIKGLGDGFGSLILQDTDSQIVVSNLTLELEGNMTTTVGGVFFKSISTIVYKEHDWIFSDLSTVTVDGVTVWVDPSGAETLGQVTFGPNDENLTLLSSGTVANVFSNSWSERIESLETCCSELKTSTGELISIIDELSHCCPDCIISVTSPDTYFVPAMIPEMMPAAHQAVVFRFEPCWGYVCGGIGGTEVVGNMPKLIFSKANIDGGTGKVKLPDGSRMIFQGEGIVELEDGVEFTSENTFLPTCSWPYVIVEERAMAKPVENAEVQFAGWLNVVVRDAGMILQDVASRILFGAQEFNMALNSYDPLAASHQVDLQVDGVGSVILNDPDARMTFERGTFNLNFSRNSLLSILDGRVEFNSNDLLYLPGNLSTFIFSEGSNLEVRRGVQGVNGGLIRFSPNLDNTLVIWDNRTGVIDGGGHKNFGKGSIQFIADDLNGASGINSMLTGVINTTLRLQDNYYEVEDTIVEQFLQVTLLLKSGIAQTSPSDINILVNLADDAASLAAIDPRRTGSVIELVPGDHDVAYESIDSFGFGTFPIIGRNQAGNFFEIDQNGNRKIIS